MMAAPEATVSQLAAALRYAALGWQVIPLHTPGAAGCSCTKPCGKSAGKHPRFADWVKRATTDEQAIRGWWRTWPSANVGLVTGARSGFFVLDVDPDKEGEVTLALLSAEHGPLPQTVEALTGSGGRHLLFRYPGHHVPNSTQRLGPGLDVRGDGGQIVAAPSQHKAGGTYEWQPDCAPGQRELAAAPAWLLDLLRAAPPPAPLPPSSSDNATARARAYIAKMPQAISGARGHDSLWDVSIALCRGFRLSSAEAVSLILSDYNARCDPPWSAKEVEHKVADAINKASVPFGYLLDVPRAIAAQPVGPTSPAREPGEDDGAPDPPKSRFNLQPISVLLAEQIPPTKWLLTPYVPSASVGELVGPPGKGKTTFMAWMLMQMAMAGYFCAIFEEEGSKRGLQRTISRALASVGGDVGDRVHFEHAAHVNLLDKRDVKALAIALTGFDFVLFDSFNLVTPGLDEDKSKEMTPVINDLRWLRDQLSIAVWLNHHSGKSKWKLGDVPKLGDGRGSSALPGALDAELSMRPVENPETGFIQFDLFVTKMREGDDQIAPKRVSIARNGPSAVLQMTDPEDEGASVDAPMELAVLKYLAKVGPDGTSKNRIEENVRGDTNRIRAALQSLKQSGQAEEIPHGKYSKWRFAGVR